MGSKKRKVEPVPPKLEAYVVAIANLPGPLRDEVLLYLDQQDLSRAATVIMPMPVIEEIKIFHDCIAKIATKKSDDMLKIWGVSGISYQDFGKENSNFICLAKFPKCQTFVGPRGINNRPAWLTGIYQEVFVVSSNAESQ